MSDTYVVRLPWPEPALWQNRRVHWRVRAKATKAARMSAWGIACDEGLFTSGIKSPRLVFSFYPPDRRKRDLQNMPATMKAAIDGIADALGVDDHGFKVAWPEAFGEPRPGGLVVVEISEATDLQKP